MIIYQGALNIGRGLELIISTMQFLDEFVLIMAGEGDISLQLKELTKELGMDDRVEFAGRYQPDALYLITCSCDLGISLEEDRGLNYRYALPNKLFDYIQARIPVLCSDLPEMRQIVENYNVGISTGERDPGKTQSVPRNMFPEDTEIEVGMQFHAQGPNGETLVVSVVEVEDENVTVDGNHPLAGVQLNFAVEVVEVREASKEELDHGHVHGPDGHDH